MILGFAIVGEVLGSVIGVVHSSFAKSYELDRLYPNNDAKGRIINLIWHLPSVTWGALAFAILIARSSGMANLPLTAVAVFIFGVSGTGNLWAHRKPFIGGILLLVPMSMVLLDWFANL